VVVVSVKQKIVLSLWLITLLMLALAGVLASLWFTRDQSSRLDDFLLRESHAIQEVLQTYFNVNAGEGPEYDSVTNTEFLAFLDSYFNERSDRPQPYKTTLGVFTPAGNPVKATNSALNLNVADLPDASSLQLVTVNGHPSFRLVAVPITHNKQVLGSIRVACLTVSLDDGWNSFLFSLIAVLGLVFVCFGFLGTVFIHWSLRPVRHMSDSAQRISESHLDLRLTVPPGQDEIAQMAKTLNTLLAKLERDFEFEEALVGQLSHELRTPLTILRGRNEVALERGQDQAPVQQVFEDNLADIDNIVSLLNTLLNLARMEGRKEQITRQPCDLALVLQDLIDDLQPLWQEKDLSFHLSLPDRASSWTNCPPLETSGDPSLLRQAFLNILTNSFKYTPRGSRIHLYIEEAAVDGGPVWRLTFRNSGPSIPEEALELVFKRFYRVEIQDPDRFEKTSGLGQRGFGLGLSITKTVIELHNGQVRAYNPPSGGAAFEILLPRTMSPRSLVKQRSFS
jgi:signal transduction histidine kinase